MRGSECSSPEALGRLRSLMSLVAIVLEKYLVPKSTDIPSGLRNIVCEIVTRRLEHAVFSRKNPPTAAGRSRVFDLEARLLDNESRTRGTERHTKTIIGLPSR